MASITSTGIGSGLDVNSIVTQLIAVESRPLTLLKSQATDLNTQISTFGKLQSYLSSLQDKARALNSTTLWKQTVATVSDSSAMTVSNADTQGAPAGSYSVSVSALATRQTVIGAAKPDATGTLSEGTLTIQLGSWSGSSFTAKTGSSPVTVTLGASDTSLSAIRDKINAAGAGVVASIVTDASGARLAIRSSDTGASNGFRITTAETVDDGDATTGLSALTYNPAAAGSQMSRTQAAGNVSATINGIAVDSASNTLSGVLDGLTLNLAKTTSSPVEVTVAADTASIRKAVTDFVSSFNDLAGFLHTQTQYDAATKKAGALQGDPAAVGLQSQLRNTLNVSSSASATWSHLSDIGIAMGTDGKLSVKDTKLDSALGNLAELKKLITTDGATSEASGFARRLQTLASQTLDTDGTVDARLDSLNARLRRNGKDQDSMQLRLQQTEARLRAQYTALDGQMGRLSGLSGYLTQQITAYNNSSNKN